MTDPEKKHKGITAFIDRHGQAGLLARQEGAQAGHPRLRHQRDRLRGLPRARLENRLGEEGEGFKIAMAVLDAGRIGIASQALGIAEAAYEASLSYASEREAFGQKIGEFQGIGFKLADMKTRIEAARLLIYNAALAKERSKQTGERFTLEASMAKLFASETAMFVRARRGADPRRDGLQQGAAGGALLPRRQDHRDLRRHQRDPAPGDRQIGDRAEIKRYEGARARPAGLAAVVAGHRHRHAVAAPLAWGRCRSAAWAGASHATCASSALIL